MREIREQLLRERSAALDTRDPLAIRKAGDRFKAISDALDGLAPETEINPESFTVGLRAAAKALGHSVKEVKAMARQRRLPVRHVGGEMRVPLSALL